MKIDYNGSRDIEIREGGWNTKPFKIRATSETGNIAHRKTSMTWHFKGEDGIEYRIQIQEVTPIVDGVPNE